MSQVMRLRATVRGYVQGVGFRAYVRRRALALGLDGYVRNTWDGDVEVLAMGPRRELESLLDDLRRGPSESEVSSVDAAWTVNEAEDGCHGFEVRWI
jgi:acylphosphatase